MDHYDCKVEGNNTKKQTQLLKEKCELALEGERCQEDLEKFALLVDDEELELRELQAGPNPLRCSAHFATNGLHGCSLCKGWYEYFVVVIITVLLFLLLIYHKSQKKKKINFSDVSFVL